MCLVSVLCFAREQPAYVVPATYKPRSKYNLHFQSLHCIVLGREWHVTLCTYVCMYAPALTPFPITTVVQSWR